jgi:hypothetical protein
MVHLQSLVDSALYQRITNSSLKALIDTAAPRAAALLGHVVHDMPLYTLHTERHVLNVLGWIQSLLGSEGIGKLSELECALAILAAYTHDLGMTLTEDERAAILKDDPAWRRHRDRFPEETSLIARLQARNNEKDHYRTALIEHHLITDYVRATHAGQPGGRLQTRLQAISAAEPRLAFEFGGVDLTLRLELLALSHNHPVDWLRLEFERRTLPWRTSIDSQRLNFPFLGILLRLADILDFDSSRTPAILFRHLGLDQPLADRFSEISADEWRKHLGITDTPVSSDGATVTYRAEACPDPVTHKSILHFVALIQDELRRCAFELRPAVDAVPDDRARLALRLAKVEHSITPCMDAAGEPAYSYHDWSFRLDQDEIICLL